MNTIAGKYEVIGKIGQGGMGAVYKARHVVLDTVVALKVLPDHLADDADLVARFQREARVMARLRHDNIVHVFDIDRDGSSYYLIEEFVDGENLATYLKRRGALPVEEALEIATQVARALAFAHARNVIHRDIKPSNVLIANGLPLRALVADFGIAKVDDASDRTQTGAMLGSLKYASPEQLGARADGKPVKVDARADVFSLGLVIYEMCEGRPFFDMDPSQVIAALVHDREPLVPRFSKPVPPALVELVTHTLARNPAERPASMAAIAAHLEACRRADAPAATPRAWEEPPTGRHAVDGMEHADVDLTPLAAELLRVGGGPARRTSSRTALWAAGAALVVVTAMLGWIVPRRGEPLRWADVTPSGAGAHVEESARLAFAARLADDERARAARLTWLLDGVPQGEGPSWTLTPRAGDGGATRTVSVIARTGEETLERSWQVEVVSRPSPPAGKAAESPAAGAPPPTLTPAAPLTIVARTPAGEKLVDVEAGQAVDFAVRSEPAGPVTYTWLLDGKPIGHEPSWRFAAPTDGDAPATRRVDVAVSRDGDPTPATASWTVAVSPGRPRIVAGEPRRTAFATPTGQPVRFSVRGSGPAARYEWKVDKHPVAGTADTFILPAATEAGEHEVEVTAVDARGTRSVPQRWAVTVHTVDAAPGLPVRAEEHAERPVTEDEVREWVSRLRTAYDRHDTSALRELGVAGSADEGGSRVELGDASIIVDPRGASVFVDRTQIDEDGGSHVRRERYRVTRGPAGLVAAPR